MIKPTLLVLAAGMGSRYGGLKQVDAFGRHGEAILDYSVYDAIAAGFGKIVFVIRKDIKDAFKSKFDGKFSDKVKVEYAFQELDSKIPPTFSVGDRTKPWGTAHAVLVASELIQEPFAVINADDYYGPDAFMKMGNFLMNRCTKDIYSMVGYRLSNTLSENGAVSRGVCTVDSGGFLTSVTERTKILRQQDGRVYFSEQDQDFPLPDETTVSMNFWGFHQDVFPYIQGMFDKFLAEKGHEAKSEFYIPSIANQRILDGDVRLEVMTSNDQWYGVTYPEDKPVVIEALRTMAAREIYPEPLWD
jgi:NDP-sugar pyrophosphorylase family protein